MGISVSGELQVVKGKQASPDSQSAVELHGVSHLDEASSKDFPQKKVLLSLHGVYPKQMSPASHSSLLPDGHGLPQDAEASSQVFPQKNVSLSSHEV
jgi:hypothetical protein